MTGQMFDPGPPPRAGDDLVEPGRAQRQSATLALEHHEHPIRRGGLGPLQLQVAGQGGEETRRYRNDPLCPPLPSAMNNRFSPGCTSGSRSPSTSQRRSPPSSITCTMARSRWVRNAASRASASPGSMTRGKCAGCGSAAPCDSGDVSTTRVAQDSWRPHRG